MPNAHEHANVVGVILGDLQSRLPHRLFGRAHRVLDKKVHLADVFFLNPVERVEITNFAGDFRREIGGIEAGDRPDPGSRGHQRFPVFFDPGPERRDQPQSGYHHAAVAINVTSHNRSPFLCARILGQLLSDEIIENTRLPPYLRAEFHSPDTLNRDRLIVPCTLISRRAAISFRCERRFYRRTRHLAVQSRSELIAQRLHDWSDLIRTLGNLRRHRRIKSLRRRRRAGTLLVSSLRPHTA